jgi:hypothetical protein
MRAVLWETERVERNRQAAGLAGTDAAWPDSGTVSGPKTDCVPPSGAGKACEITAG